MTAFVATAALPEQALALLLLVPAFSLLCGPFGHAQQEVQRPTQGKAQHPSA
ncbi:MAG: hypothetical protein M3Z20_20885 [Chloroflexota bacterium]|nr:hypothetical protein [Chloroflexota bacterium]